MASEAGWPRESLEGEKAVERLQREGVKGWRMRSGAIAGGISCCFWGPISQTEGGRKGLWSSVKADWRSYPEH